MRPINDREKILLGGLLIVLVAGLASVQVRLEADAGLMRIQDQVHWDAEDHIRERLLLLERVPAPGTDPAQQASPELAPAPSEQKPQGN